MTLTGRTGEAFEPFPPGATLGILGGGQLGRMLAMAAARLGYRTIVLDPDPHAPAAQVASEHVAAPYDDPPALRRLAACDAVTYEFENVPAAAFDRFGGSQTRVAPLVRSLRTTQDRRVEKNAIEGFGLPVAPWRVVDNAHDLDAAREALGDLILKTARGGYDGKGQRTILADAPTGEVRAALDALGRGLVAERRVPLDAEMSVIAVRGADGRAIAFDPTRNVHEDGILRRSTVPAGLGALEDEARRMALRLAEGLGHVGAMGVEFFVSSGELLVNEIAPRVHNSGHWTEAACPIDQFEAHIRAVAGLPLGDGSRHSDAEMGNLLGEEANDIAALLAEPNVRVHLYGKGEARAGRKMGHWTRITPLSGAGTRISPSAGG